jgi:ArsR family transcriptional regulator, arsenate/arsenite/antimonite-responsive transcriptional repressor
MTDEDVTDQLADLAERVSALETALQSVLESGPVAPGGAAAAEAPGVLDTALLERLQHRSGPRFEDGSTQGSVLYAGAAQLGGGTYAWQMERPVPGLLATDDDLIAGTLAAIANPTRVRLLKAVLAGAHEIHDLQEALGGVSTGQLYHHLKELTAAGLIRQRSRGRYEAAPRTVVPILAVIAAVYDLAAAD